MDFGAYLGSNLDQNSTQNRTKARRKSTLEKVPEKYTLLGEKSILSKWKNIAKTLYYRSKSHFSHIRNEVEKATLKPLILERFWEPKSSQYREKVVLNSI